MSANPVQAKAHEPTGDQISVRDVAVEYPANTPFYIAHGWYFDPTIAEIYQAGNFDFKLQVDGVYIKESFVDRTKSITEDGFLILIH